MLKDASIDIVQHRPVLCILPREESVLAIIGNEVSMYHAYACLND